MNKVFLIGRLARDPEMRTTSSNVLVTRFTVAVSRAFNPQAGGQPQTDFIGCLAWGKIAENVAKYCTKGSQVAVEGRIQTGSYDGQDGQRHYSTDIVSNSVTFLTSKKNEESQNVQQTAPEIVDDPFADFGEQITLDDEMLPF